jgi:CheY-like chemotaxis protein
MPNPQQTVLVVDDSHDDLTLVRMAFNKAAPEISLRIVDNGIDALAYLEGIGEFSDREMNPSPKWMLLDLKMPRMNGFEVLERLQNTRLQSRPFVIVMSSSRLAEDVEKAHALGADFYHAKPANFDDLCALIKRLAEFFRFSPPRKNHVTLPDSVRTPRPGSPTVDYAAAKQ